MLPPRPSNVSVASDPFVAPRRCTRRLSGCTTSAFQYEFEHGDTDVDADCRAGGCPSASLAGGRDGVIETARELATDAASSAPWTNAALHEYLEAIAAWLADSGGYYANCHRVPPDNGWEIVSDALRAATAYE
jgi:hypothetical protein